MDESRIGFLPDNTVDVSEPATTNYDDRIMLLPKDSEVTEIDMSGKGNVSMDMLSTSMERGNAGLDAIVAASAGDVEYALKAFKGVTPETATKVAKIAKERRENFENVLVNKDAWDEANEEVRIYNSLFEKDEKGSYKYPRTVQWMANPVNMAQSKDDIKALQEIEHWQKLDREKGEGYFKTGLNTAIAAASTLGGSMARLPALTSVISDLPLNMLAEITGLKSLEREVPKEFYDNWLTQTLDKNVQHYTPSVAEGDFIERAKNGDYAGAAKNVLLQSAINFPNTIAAMALTASGNPAAAAAFMGATQAASTIKDDVEMGKSPINVAANSIGSGVLESAWESVGTIAILKRWLGSLEKTAGKSVALSARKAIAEQVGEMVTETAKAMGQEGLTELGTTASQMYLDMLTGNPEGTKDFSRALIQSFAVGGVSGAGMTGLFASAKGVNSFMSSKRESENFNNMAKAVAESNTNGRAPEVMAMFINDVNEKTGTDPNLYIDPNKVETLLQSDKEINRKEFLDNIGHTEESLAKAKKDGTELEVDKGTWLSRFAGTPVHEKLKNAIRLGTDHLTEAEREELRKELKASLEREMQGTAQAIEDEDAIPQIDEAKRLLTLPVSEGGAGFTTDEANTQLAILVGTARFFAKERGETLGKTLTRMGFGLRFQKEATDPVALFQRDQAPAFYSKLQRTIEEKVQGKTASVEQLRGLLKDVKPEELQYSGLEKFLEGKTKVSKEELLSFVQENQIQIEEITKADTKTAGFDIIDTKFKSYSTPGGSNYREILFTLPEKRTPDMTFGEWYLENNEKPMFEKMSQREMADYYEEFVKPGRTTSDAFKSSHWDEKNVLAHTRLQDFTDSDGNKVLLVDEIQSDWHQKGREQGYAAPTPKFSKDDLREAGLAESLASTEAKNVLRRLDFLGFDTLGEAVSAVKNNEDFAGMWHIEDEDDIRILKNYRDLYIRHAQMVAETGDVNAVPDAPFKKNWHEFVFKKVLDMAVKQGYDKVAWTTGGQQAQRYHQAFLDKVKRVHYIKLTDNMYHTKVETPDGTMHERVGNVNLAAMNPKEMADVYGKDIANKIINDEGTNVSEKSEYKSIESENVTIGGEGMKGFYDKIIPEFVNRYTKKWGGKVENTVLNEKKKTEAKKVSEGDFKPFKQGDKTIRYDYVDPESGEVYSIEQTPEDEWTLQHEHDRKEYFFTFSAAVERTQEIIAEVKEDENKRNAANIKVHSINVTPQMREAIIGEGQPLFQKKAEEKNLIVMNNISSDRIEQALELGGLAMPSLGVTKVDSPYEGFGDITLLAAPGMLESGYISTYNADVYSPRFPNTRLELDEKVAKSLEKEYGGKSKVLGTYSNAFERDGLATSGLRSIERDLVIKERFLESKKIKVRLPKVKSDDALAKAYPKLYAHIKEAGDLYTARFGKDTENDEATNKTLAEYKALVSDYITKEAEDTYGADSEQAKEVAKVNIESAFEDSGHDGFGVYRIFESAIRDEKKAGTVDEYAYKDVVDKAIKKNEKEYLSWVKNTFEPMFKGPALAKYYGPTNTRGSRWKLTPLTLENAVSEMRKESVRGGERFLSGPGTIRAQLAKEFKSIASIQKNRDMIVSKEEMDKVKKDLEAKYSAATKYLDPNGFHSGEILEDIAKRGFARVEKDLGREIRNKDAISEYLKALAEAPTEYFEAKARRAVGFEEFAAAVVPATTSEDVVKKLEAKGLKVFTYSEKKEGDRAKQIKKASKEIGILFQKNPTNARGSIAFTDSKTIITLFKDKNLSTLLHETGHLMVREMQRLVADGQATEQTVKDLQTLEEFSGGLNSTEGQEKLARAWEAYFMRGEAPSLSLQSIFAKFRAWLTAIYKSVANLNVEVTPEVKEVFDRVLASEKDVAEAKAYYEGRKSLAEALGLNLPEEVNAKKEKATMTALDKQVKRYMRAYLRALKMQGETLNDYAKRKVEDERVYKMMTDAIAKGGLDEKVIASFLGEEAVAKIKKAHRNVAVTKTPKGPVKVELTPKLKAAVAEEFEYNIQTMISQIDDAEAGGKAQEIYKDKPGGHWYHWSSTFPDWFKNAPPKSGKQQFRDGVRVRGRSKLWLLTKDVANRSYTGLMGDEFLLGLASQSLIDASKEHVEELRLRLNDYLARISDEEVDKFTASVKYQHFIAMLEAKEGRVDSETDDTLMALVTEYGYESPEALLSDIVDAKPKREAIKEVTKQLRDETEKRVRDELSKHETVPGEEAVHNGDSLEILIAEAQLIVDKNNRDNPERKIRRLEERVVRDEARAFLGRQKFSRAIRYDLHAKAEQKAGNEAIKYAEEGKLIESHDAKKRQIFNHAVVLESVKIREAMDAFLRSVAAKNIKAKLKNVNEDFANHVSTILNRFKLSSAELPVKQALVNLADLDENLDALIPDWVKNGRDGIDSWKDLSVNEVNELVYAVDALVRVGRDTLDELKIKGIESVDQFIAKAVPLIRNLPDRKIYEEGTTKRKVADGLAAYVAGDTQMELLADELDDFMFVRNGTFGPNRLMVKGAVDATYNANAQMTKVREASEKHWKTLHNARKRLEKLLGGEKFTLSFLPPTEDMIYAGRPRWTVENLIAMVLNMGNESSMTTLKNAYGYSEEQFNKVRALFTDEELNAIQGIWDATNLLWEPLSATMYEIYHRHPVKVEATPITTTRDGGETITLHGGYYPLIFDHDLNLKAEEIQAQKKENQDLMKNQMKSVFRTTKPEDGFTHQRKPGHSLPPLLKLSVWADHVQSTAQYIGFAKYLRDVNRITLNKDWRQAIVDKKGKAYYTAVRHWVEHMANPNRIAGDQLDRIMNWLRGKASGVILMFNMGSAVKQKLGLFLAIKEIGWKHYIEGLRASDWRSFVGLEGSTLHQTIMSKSKFVPIREGNIHREMSDMMDRLKPDKRRVEIAGHTYTWDDVKEWGWALMVMSDRGLIDSTWWGAYNKYLSENLQKSDMTPEEREADAIRKADSLISTTQPDSLAFNQSDFQNRQGGLWRMFTAFMSGQTKYGNIMRHELKALKAGAIDRKTFWMKVMYSTILTGWTSALIGSLMGGDGLPEEYEWLTSPIDQRFSYIPFARDISGLIKYGKPIGGTPTTMITERFSKSAISSYKAIADNGEWSKAAWDLAQFFESLSGVPSVRLYKDMMKNYSIITTGKKEER